MVLWLAAEQRSGLTVSLGPGDKILPLLCQYAGAHLAPLYSEQLNLKKIIRAFLCSFSMQLS